MDDSSAVEDLSRIVAPPPVTVNTVNNGCPIRKAVDFPPTGRETDTWDGE
jgi:hypothetical protein